MAEMCLQWNIGPGAVDFYVEGDEYSFMAGPPLMEDDTYHEVFEVVTTETIPFGLLCVKRVIYVTSLNLPIWERRIPHQLVKKEAVPTGGGIPRNYATKFECPLR